MKFDEFDKETQKYINDGSLGVNKLDIDILTSLEESLDNMNEDIEVHDTLNSILFDEDDELKEKVKYKLLNIVNEVQDIALENEIDLVIKDVILLGSNCSYNYTKDSDIDLHIVADTEKNDCTKHHLEIIYNLFKSSFNDKYDVKIKGIPVELYIEENETTANSNGIYSLYTGWIKKPTKESIPIIDYDAINKNLDKYVTRYNELVKELGYQELLDNDESNDKDSKDIKESLSITEKMHGRGLVYDDLFREYISNHEEELKQDYLEMVYSNNSREELLDIYDLDTNISDEELGDFLLKNLNLYDWLGEDDYIKDKIYEEVNEQFDEMYNKFDKDLSNLIADLNEKLNDKAKLDIYSTSSHSWHKGIITSQYFIVHLEIETLDIDEEILKIRFSDGHDNGRNDEDIDIDFRYYSSFDLVKIEDEILCKLEDSFDMSILDEAYEPNTKGIAYKVFRVKNGKLYPPMVANHNNESTPIGVWLDAEEGEFAGLSKTGRPQVKSIGSGTLSYRPGWHLGEIPRAKQFDRLNKETGEVEFPKDFVWAKCEYAMDVDYQPESDARGYERTKRDEKGNVITYKSDKYQHSLAGVSHLPSKGYYRYRTNPNPDTIPWIITGQMKVVELLDDYQVNKILEDNGIAPIHRQGGDKTLKELEL